MSHRVTLVTRTGEVVCSVPRASLSLVSSRVAHCPPGDATVVLCAPLCAAAKELLLSYVLCETDRDSFFMLGLQQRIGDASPEAVADLANAAASLHLVSLLSTCVLVIRARAPECPRAP